MTKTVINQILDCTVKEETSLVHKSFVYSNNLFTQMVQSSVGTVKLSHIYVLNGNLNKTCIKLLQSEAKKRCQIYY